MIVSTFKWPAVVLLNLCCLTAQALASPSPHGSCTDAFASAAQPANVESEYLTVKRPLREELTVRIKRGINRIKYNFDLLPGKKNTDVMLADDVARALWMNSILFTSEYSVFEALDADGNVLFHTKSITSNRYTSVEALKELKGLLIKVRGSSAGSRVVRIRSRHTHPSDPDYDYSHFSPADRRVLLAEKSLVDLALRGPVSLDFEIIYQARQTLFRRSVSVPAEFSELNNSYFTKSYTSVNDVIRRSGPSVREAFIDGLLKEGDPSATVDTSSTGRPLLSALKDPRLP